MEYVIVLLLSTCVLLLMFSSLRLAQYRRRIRRRTKAMNPDGSYEKELLRSRLEVQEHALQHVSTEINDNIGQVLSGVQLKLASLSGSLSEQGEARTFSEVVSGMGKSIHDLRKLGQLIDPLMIQKIGLPDAIEKELALVALNYNLQCTFTFSEDLPSLNQEQDILLFRIVQESITNVCRHAAATGINIHISYTAPVLSLMISDNGRGMDLKASLAKGSGLRQIEERIKLLNGGLDIITQEGDGTTLILTCKLQHE